MTIQSRLPTASGRNVISAVANELRGLRKLADERRAASFASFRRALRTAGSPRSKGPPGDHKPLAA
jgi:hypothetical protein